MLTEEQKKDAINTTQKWVETFIIGLNLCPFAKSPFQKEGIRFTVADCENSQMYVETFINELEFLNKNKKTETTLLIIPGFGKPEHLQAYLEFCEQIIIINNWGSKYQIVSFHPYARFLGIAPDSPKNLTGIAPYPVLHILRTPSVDALENAVKKDIHVQNDERLEKMTHEELKKLWDKVME